MWRKAENRRSYEQGEGARAVHADSARAAGARGNVRWRDARNIQTPNVARGSVGPRADACRRARVVV
eukprot:5691473-Pleurochrysis_carterae.AAC.1